MSLWYEIQRMFGANRHLNKMRSDGIMPSTAPDDMWAAVRLANHPQIFDGIMRQKKVDLHHVHVDDPQSVDVIQWYLRGNI